MAIKSTDAAGKTPNLIPDEELLPRDNSGGLDYKNTYTAHFGDGGHTTGGGAVGTGVSGNPKPKA